MNKTLLSTTLALLAALAVGCSTPVDLSESSPRDTPDAAAPATERAPDSSPAGMDAMDDTEYRCDADSAQSLVGKAVNSDTEARAKALSGSKTVRTLRPDNVFTMEYNPQRINLRVDDQDIITSVGCG